MSEKDDPKTLANLFDTFSKGERVEFAEAMEAVYAERKQGVEAEQKIRELSEQLNEKSMQLAAVVHSLDLVMRVLYQAQTAIHEVQDCLQQADIVLPADQEQWDAIDREREERQAAAGFADAAAREVLEKTEWDHECSPASCGMQPEYDFTDAVPVERPPNLKRTKKP